MVMMMVNETHGRLLPLSLFLSVSPRRGVISPPDDGAAASLRGRAGDASSG